MSQQLTPQQERDAIQSYTERRRIAEELRREGKEGQWVDVADKCVCERCGTFHYRVRPKQ